MPHASMRDYVIGFILSVTLTAIPFWLVMTMPLSAGATGAIIMGFAVVQIVVHMVYFLHMTPTAEGGWSLTSLVFTIKIGRASCRERVCQSVENSVVAVSLKKKKTK